MREILFVAGEASGDSHGALVARELVSRGAPFALVGVGGDQMRAAGVELIAHTGQLAVMGFVEVLETIPRHIGLLRKIKQRLRGGHVAAVVLIDYPDFNMFVAAAAKAAGVPVLYYITPQVWAWRAGRLDTLARTISRAAVILPFEEKLLRSRGIDATFVGHPLIDRVGQLPERDDARAALGVSRDDRVLALFPGSRRQEIEHHLDAFVAVARALQRRIPALKVIVAVAPHVTLDAARCPFPMVRSASFTVFRAADAAFCKSGTTTLEAAVAGCPLVVAYRMNRVNYAVARAFVKIDNIGLVNLIAERRLVPEFVQDALQPAAVADALEPLLDHASAARRAMVEGLRAVRASLGEPGAAGRVASMVLELAGQGPHG
ncbi:MAG TPA: lipid-A-disaccharide synthase [Gemmatimonadaceae bacterium]|nr:lipid-A-disaccharide synthase [Gemmatimonadaceae bacterium]